MIRPVLLFPAQELRRKAQHVIGMDEGLHAFINDLVETMDAAHAAGISAPQLGVELAIITIAASIAGTSTAQVVINPKVLEFGIAQRASEGCLSFPGEFLEVERPQTVKIQARDVFGNKYEINAEGFYARALQHELDHLDGKLMVDYATRQVRRGLERKFKKIHEKFGNAMYYGDPKDYKPNDDPILTFGKSTPEAEIEQVEKR